MLEELTVDQARSVAGLAQAARQVRDRSLSELGEQQLGEPVPARGEHNPAGAAGLDPLPVDHPKRLALQRAIAELSAEARWELQALVWLGQGEYAAKGWRDAVAAASTAADASIEAMIDQPDLHDLIMKGLYELALMP